MAGSRLRIAFSALSALVAAARGAGQTAPSPYDVTTYPGALAGDLAYLQTLPTSSASLGEHLRVALGQAVALAGELLGRALDVASLPQRRDVPADGRVRDRRVVEPRAVGLVQCRGSGAFVEAAMREVGLDDGGVAGAQGEACFAFPFVGEAVNASEFRCARYHR